MHRNAQIRRIIVIITALTAASLSLSACGSNSKSGSDQAGNTIKIMTIAPTGTEILNFPTATVVQAYADKANAAGGINGRHIEVIACNDKFDPNEATNCARTAVQENVAAVVGGFSAYDDQILSILEQAGIPYIGNAATSAKDFTSKSSYPILAGPIGFAALGGYAAQACKTTTTVILDVPAAASILPFASKALEAAGKKLGPTVKVSQTTVDYSSAAEAISKYDCAIVGLPSAAVEALVAAKAQLGVKTRLLTPVGAVDGLLLKKFSKDLQGSVTLTQFAVLDDKAWDGAKAAVKDDEVLSNVIVQNSWVAMTVFDKVASAISGKVDAAAMSAAMNKAAVVNTNGLSPDLSFTKGLPIPQLARISNSKVAVLLIKDGSLVPLGGFTDLGGALAGR